MSDDRQPRGQVQWQEMRCIRCGRLLQRVEEGALYPGKHLQVRCSDCKTLNYLVATDPSDSR